jgi:hypothetical protein
VGGFASRASNVKRIDAWLALSCTCLCVRADIRQAETPSSAAASVARGAHSRLFRRVAVGDVRRAYDVRRMTGVVRNRTYRLVGRAGLRK